MLTLSLDMLGNLPANQLFPCGLADHIEEDEASMEIQSCAASQLYEALIGRTAENYPNVLAGFVVFYDFLLGLDPTYRVCRLVVGLYHGGQEMGDSSPLPAVYCDIDNSAAYFPDAGGGNRAIVAMKQVVRRVRPSPGISLIMELQASGGCDPYGQDINRLISRGWIKIDIFDSQNRVISGRWKVPVRVLPVKPSMTTSELNGVPQLENVELYLRLVNARDANVQTTAAIDSNNATLYKYPPLV
eukprot:g43379.t1